MGAAAPAVTVVVPVWDSHVGYLPEALAALLAQVPQPEVLVVDNCSECAVSVPVGVRLARTPRRLTTGAARSFGLARVSTALVMFWDADDLMAPGTVAALTRRMASDPGLVLVATRIVEEDGTLHHWPRPGLTRALARWPGLVAAVSAVSSLVPAVGSLMRTDTARDAGGFPDLEASDDWVLAVAMALRGRVDVISHVGRIYRRHGASLSLAHRTPADRRAHARAVRARLSADPAAPRVLAAAGGPLALAQLAVITVLGPLRRALGRARPEPRRPDAASRRCGGAEGG